MRETTCQGSTSYNLRLRSLPPESIVIDGLIIGFELTSHGEDVHVRVGLFAIPISRGPNEW